MTLTVAQLIKKLSAVPQDFAVVVMAREKPLPGSNTPGIQAAGDAYTIGVDENERAVYIHGKN